MKKRKWILPLGIVGTVVILCTLAVFAFGALISAKGYSISTGRLYFAEQGTYLIDSEDMAMRVSDCSEDESLFEGYKSGDRVILLHDEVLLTYPSMTGGYRIFRLSRGDSSYKPADEVLGVVTDEQNDNGDSALSDSTGESDGIGGEDSDIGNEAPVSSILADNSSSQGEDVSSSVSDNGDRVSLSQQIIVNTYVLSTKHPNDLSNFTVVRTLNDKANTLIENLLREPNFEPKSENEWVKFVPSRPNEYALAIEFMDGNCLIIAIHFSSESGTYYIATAESNGKFDKNADYSSLEYQRGIASEELGEYLGNLTFNYSE